MVDITTPPEETEMVEVPAVPSLHTVIDSTLAE
jgi:hypothetical protein